MVCFHDQVGQQLLAGRIYFLACFGFGVGFEGHGHVATDAHVGDAREVEVFHIVHHGFALRIKEFAVRHDVDFCNEFHDRLMRGRR